MLINALPAQERGDGRILSKGICGRMAKFHLYPAAFPLYC